jgi:LuxR family maltose regulon positive regulatory protein
LRLAEGDTTAAAALLNELRPLVQDGPYAMVEHMLEAAEAQVRLALGDTTSAAAWASRVAWDRPAGVAVLAETLRWGAGAVEAAAVTPARVLMVHGRVNGDGTVLDRAEHHLDAAWRLTVEHGLGWLRLRVLIMRALLADARGERAAALRSLGAAVAQAEPEGVIRPFLVEGPLMVELLNDLRATAPKSDGISPRSIETLLSAFPGRGPERPGTGLVEPLTPRELDVLRLLAAGHSNAEMAAELFVEPSTVKTHLIHLYGKLGVHSRTQALANARALRLLT